MNTPRREFLKTTGGVFISASALSLVGNCDGTESVTEGTQPNVILVITDDQGYGDLGYHGNDNIKTPNIDQFAGESVDFIRFYVCPVCAPTRASLLTGRYNYRTCVTDTMSGGALIHPDEVTIAEIFSAGGYATGIFGKWHLGDNYPRRPIDQGFHESLVHNGGGIGQPSDPPGNGYGQINQRKNNYHLMEPLRHYIGSNSYFDPVLQHNGKQESYEGYCTDIFFDAALTFIEEHKNEPFFAYLPTNTPHEPLIVGDEYLKPYKDMGLDDETAGVYAMITNIDDNFGRLRNRLRELDLEDNTILIFMGDNGPQHQRYNAGLRARKGSVYEGGIRVPFIINCPEMLTSGSSVDNIAAHIDVLPTLLEACGIDKPDAVSIDGKSLMPLLKGETADWPDRTIFIERQRGIPQLYRNSTAINQQYKLVNGKELYNLIIDPSEKNDIAGDYPELVARMRGEYEAWFNDVGSTRGFEPMRITLGTPHENPVILTPQDCRGPHSRWTSENYIGYWLVDVKNAGSYEITLRFKETEAEGIAHFSLGDVSVIRSLRKGETIYTFGPLDFDAGGGKLEAWLELREKTVFVNYIDVKWLG